MARVPTGSPTAAVSVAGAEGGILEIFYNATDGPNWTNDTNWVTDAPLSKWHGVQTDADGRVTRIWLADNGLAGELPSELGDLDGLYLYENQLTGSIHPELFTHYATDNTTII